MTKKAVTLFIIEDDEVDFKTIQRSLAKKMVANHVVRAKDGVHALELLRQGEVPTPYIILLDIQMPRMNGLEFLKVLRADEIFKASIVFMLTSSKDEDDIVSSYQNHAAGYFVKEQAGDGLLEIVDALKGYWKVAYLPEG